MMAPVARWPVVGRAPNVRIATDIGPGPAFVESVAVLYGRLSDADLADLGESASAAESLSIAAHLTNGFGIIYHIQALGPGRNTMHRVALNFSAGKCFATQKDTSPELVEALSSLVGHGMRGIASVRDQLVRRPVATSFSERRALARAGIKTPPPYYVVPVQQRVVPVSPPAIGPVEPPVAVDWSHRWDVRGHERVLFKRGSLPLDDADRRVLTLRGYRVYTATDGFPDDDWSRLAIRDVQAPRAGEWLAVKATWVKPHVRGPEDKPYVPALRVVQGGASVASAGTGR